MAVSKSCNLVLTAEFSGNQWSSLRSGVTWSRFLFLNTSRAALFCTRCNRAIWSAGRPMKTELREMNIAATSPAAALWDKYGPIDAICRSSKKDAQQMLLMCFCIDNVLSRWIPRYLTDVLKGTLFLPMFAHSLSTDSRQDAEPTGIISVLSVFNLSLLLFTQSRTSSIHVWIQDWKEKNWSGGALLDSSVSSAYLW